MTANVTILRMRLNPKTRVSESGLIFWHFEGGQVALKGAPGRLPILCTPCDSQIEGP